MLDKLHFWCNKVIPLVYDEALSYYETVCKLVYAINETIKNVRELNDNAVFSVNEITPDDSGNVNVGTVRSVNGSAPDASGNINLPTVAGVTSVDGIGADEQGNVQINAVKSINNITPNSSGAITLDADDVGALPDTVVPIERAILPYGFSTLSDVLTYLVAHKNCVYTYDTWATVPWGPPSNTQTGTWLFEGFCFDGQLTGINNARPVLRASFNDNYGNIAKYSVSIIYDETQSVWTGVWRETYNSKIYTTTVEANVTPGADVSVYGLITKANNYVTFGVHGSTTVDKGGDDVLFTVPQEYRPTYETYAVATIVDGTGFAIRIKTNGDVALMWQGSIQANASFYIAYSFQKIV